MQTELQKSGIIPNHKQYQLFTAILLILYLLVSLKSAWISDDAYITYRTVENFINGYGLVWNAGERVQAFTHPLWMFMLSGGRLLTGEMYYSVFIDPLTFICLGVALVLPFITRKHSDRQTINPRGWQLILPEASHAPFIELGWSYHTYYQVTYNLGGSPVAQQTIGLNRIGLDDQFFIGHI